MKKRIQLLLLLFAFFTVHTIEAQVSKPDSLENMLEINQTGKVNDIQHTAEVKQQKNLLLSLVVGFVLMLVLVVFVVRSNRFKSRINLLLTKQNDEIAALNEEYQVINEELTTTNDALVEAKQLVEESEERLINTGINTRKRVMCGLKQ